MTTVAQVYDLETDWSDTQNPNGTWSYRWGESLLLNDQFPWGDDCFGKNGITTATEADVLPGYLELGDVFVRISCSEQVNVRWTAPANGTITLSGQAWNGGGGFCWDTGLPLCASYPWMLTHNGINLSDGWTGGTRDLPYELSSGAGGATALQNIQVLAGDEIDLVFLFNPSADPGNVGIRFTVTFTPDTVEGDPLAAIENLALAVLEMNLHNGIENSLDGKLDAALNALADANVNNDVAVCNSLSAFIHAVEAQRDNKLTSEQADQLIGSAEEIQISLNCL